MSKAQQAAMVGQCKKLTRSGYEDMTIPKSTPQQPQADAPEQWPYCLHWLLATNKIATQIIYTNIAKVFIRACILKQASSQSYYNNIKLVLQ